MSDRNHTVNPLALGMGVDRHSGAVLHQTLTAKAIDGAFARNAQREAVLDCNWQSSSQTIRDSLSVNTSVKARYGLFNGSASVDYSATQESIGFSKNYFYSFHYAGGNRDIILDPDNIKSCCTGPFNGAIDDKDLAAFQQLFGNAYVSTTQEGVRCTATLKITFDSYGSAQAFSTAVEAGGGLGAFSASMSAKVKKEREERRCNATINLEVNQVGGRPSEIVAVLKGAGADGTASGGSATAATDIANITSFFDTIATNLNNYFASIGDQVAGGADGANLSVLKCSTQPYPAGLFTAGTLGASGAGLLDQLVERYYAEADRIALMQALHRAAQCETANLLPCGDIIAAALAASEAYLQSISDKVSQAFRARDDEALKQAAGDIDRLIEEQPVDVPGMEGGVRMRDVIATVALIHRKGMLLFVGDSYQKAISAAPASFNCQTSTPRQAVLQKPQQWLGMGLDEAQKAIGGDTLPVICPDPARIRFAGPLDLDFGKDYAATPVAAMTAYQIEDHTDHISGACPADTYFDAQQEFDLAKGQAVGNSYYEMGIDGNHSWYVRSYDGRDQRIIRQNISRLSWRGGEFSILGVGSNAPEVHAGRVAIMQSDGNFVVYAAYTPPPAPAPLSPAIASGVVLTTGTVFGRFAQDDTYTCYWVRLAAMFDEQGACRLLLDQAAG